MNRSAPSATVTPVLVYPDVRAAVAWLTAAFGFEERIRIGADHRSQMRIGADGAVIVADGNEFCVIEPGNNFLAGCGFLGEVFCEGTRDVGLFWRDALGWPLVWDQDEKTAVQSQRGGTKVSWGGPPVAPKHGRNRQHLDLAAPDLTVEVQRLVALGATQRADRGGDVELADPDGNEFSVSAD